MFGDEVDEFTMAVVLIDRIGSAAIDAARNLAVGELVRREPTDVVADFVAQAEAKQHRGSEGAVANPTTSVVARAAADGRTVAPEEVVGDVGASGVDEIARCGDVDVNVTDDLAPV